jgi:hypothetical protein
MLPQHSLKPEDILYFRDKQLDLYRRLGFCVVQLSYKPYYVFCFFDLYTGLESGPYREILYSRCMYMVRAVFCLFSLSVHAQVV